MSLSTGISEEVCRNNMNSFSEKVNFICSIADLIPDQLQHPIEIIEADIKALEKEIIARLKKVAG